MALSPTSSRGFHGGEVDVPIGIFTDPGDVGLFVATKAGQTTDVADFQGTAGVVSVLLDGALNFVTANGMTNDVIAVGTSNALAVNVLSVFQNFAPFATLLRITKAGYMALRTHSAPADGDVAAGECMLWFDQTDGVGNTKLMVKGKSADGTVKTASILLA